MGFSELEKLSGETGLTWDSERLLLHGRVKDYPVYIVDNPQTNEYMLTVFCRIRSGYDGAVTEGINLLLEGMPKNCVTGRKNELKYQQLKFSAVTLYQENLPLLARFVEGLCSLLDGFDLLPEEPLEETALFPKEEEKQTVPQPKKGVSKTFDKYSIRGLLGALVGAAAMTVIASILVSVPAENIGPMLCTWAAGGLIALMVLFDYSLLAKKMDIFGTVICTFITGLSCFFSALLGLRSVILKLYNTAVRAWDLVIDWQAYIKLFPDLQSNFIIFIAKLFISALAFSIIFYIFYYRRHQSIMYAEGGRYLEEEEVKKKKRK